MKTEIEQYINGIKEGVQWIKEHVPVKKEKVELEDWQIDYSEYGGYSEYLKIMKMYWNISDYYIYKEGRYNATNFPLIGYDTNTTKLLYWFRKDLKKQISKPLIYETN